MGEVLPESLRPGLLFLDVLQAKNVSKPLLIRAEQAFAKRLFGWKNNQGSSSLVEESYGATAALLYRFMK